MKKLKGTKKKIYEYIIDAYDMNKQPITIPELEEEFYISRQRVHQIVNSLVKKKLVKKTKKGKQVYIRPIESVFMVLHDAKQILLHSAYGYDEGHLSAKALYSEIDKVIEDIYTLGMNKGLKSGHELSKK